CAGIERTQPGVRRPGGRAPGSQSIARPALAATAAGWLCHSVSAGEWWVAATALRLGREQARSYRSGGQAQPAALQHKMDKASPLSTLRLLITPMLLRGRAAGDFDRSHAPRH